MVFTRSRDVLPNYDLDCDFEENGTLDVAINDAQAKVMEEEYHILKEWGARCRDASWKGA